MKMSIRFKLLPIIIIGIALLAAVFLQVTLETQRTSLEKNALRGIQSAKETFYNLEDNDIKMLKAGMIQFMANQYFKDLFLENERAKLYSHGQALYSQNKRLGITHFYFHRTNGTVFVRLHNADKYDDKVGRKTFIESKQTKNWGTGIELGQTAFALRVVHPYYNQGKLIGYVEFGEEIDHFIEIMKKQTGNEYAVVVEKKYIDPKKWASVREVKKLRNNYNDMEKYVIIDTTIDDTSAFKQHGFSRKYLDVVSDDGQIFNFFNVADKSYVDGGFSLYDAGHRKVGAVVMIEDITDIKTAYKDAMWNILIMTIIGAIVVSIIMMYMVTKVIIWPLDKVVDATTRVAGGDFSATIDVSSNDEIGRLAKLLERFKQIMVGIATEAE